MMLTSPARQRMAYLTVSSLFCSQGSIRSRRRGNDGPLEPARSINQQLKVTLETLYSKIACPVTCTYTPRMGTHVIHYHTTNPLFVSLRGRRLLLAVHRNKKGPKPYDVRHEAVDQSKTNRYVVLSKSRATNTLGFDEGIDFWACSTDHNSAGMPSRRLRVEQRHATCPGLYTTPRRG